MKQEGFYLCYLDAYWSRPGHGTRGDMLMLEDDDESIQIYAVILLAISANYLENVRITNFIEHQEIFFLTKHAFPMISYVDSIT